MRKIYLKILIAFVIILWIIYFIQSYVSFNEGFTPQFNSICRQYIRKIDIY